MAKIAWLETGKKQWETGVSKGILFPINKTTGAYEKGVPWNGLISVSESPSGAESSPIYADNVKYGNMVSAEEFAATIEAYAYPKEFEPCDGLGELTPGVNAGQQERQSFGLCYRTEIGNDISQTAGYKLHFIYGCTAAPSEKAYSSINESVDAITFSWEVSTVPVNVTGFKPTSIVTVDSTQVTTAKMTALETLVYGAGTTDGTTDPSMPSPDVIKTTISA